MKRPWHCGGSYVTRGVRNTFDYFEYAGSAKRHSIMCLEGDAALKCGEDMCYLWRGLLVDFGIDNSSFCGSVSKGYSRSSELAIICRRWFILQAQHNCLINWFWLSSEANILADHLSRGREKEFAVEVLKSGFWSSCATEDPYILRHPHAGSRRTMDALAALPKTEDYLPPEGDTAQLDGAYGPVMPPLPKRRGEQKGLRGRSWLSALCFFTLCVQGEAMPAGGQASRGGGSLEYTVQYARSLLFDGLPNELTERLHEVMDMRLSPSSMRTVEAGMRVWKGVAQKYGWPTVIPTDDRRRAAKLATLVLEMLDGTSLAYSSIALYVWGVRQHMVLHRQADPIYGVPSWREFMSSVQVLAHTQVEPRRELPMEVIQKILEDTDDTSFVDVNFAFFLVILVFTFSRSETPCPKTFSGFDRAQYWQVRDIRWRCVDAVYCLAVRFKAIKQDPRITRRSANDGGDWSYVGDVPGPFSVLSRFQSYMSFFPSGRDEEAPFFLARDRARPYTYAAAMADLRERCARVGVDGSRYGIHGVRVAGYNASARANGHDVTICHGLWSGAASSNRYHRFDVSTEIVPMAANMIRFHMSGGRGAGGDTSCLSQGDQSPRSSADVTPVVENVVAERVIRPRSGSTPEPSRQRRSAQRHNSNESGGSAGALRGTADALVEPPSELPSAELEPNLSALPQPRMSEDSPDDVLAGLQRTRRSNRNRRG